jgi:hypothetical protein
MDFTACLRLLLEEAAKLSQYCDIPVPTVAICRTLGIRLRRSRLDSGLALLVNADNSPEIVLSNTTSDTLNSLNKRERFLVAHELGHFILHRVNLPKPLGESEYWQHEQLCDIFAQTLLLPQRHLEHLKQLFDDQRPEAKLDFALYLENRALVPWAVAAHRVTQLSQDLVFMGIASEGSRLRVKMSTIGKKKEMHRLIGQHHELSKLLRGLKPDRISKKLDPSTLFVFPSLQQIACGAAATRVSEHDFRLAIKTA